jgi:hypothetical protein
MLRAAERRLVLLCVSAALACPLAAQNSDAPRAPRIIGPLPSVSAPASAPTGDAASAATAPFVVARRPPNAARLAPLPEQRSDDETEEIVVIGQGWRLPDLGSEWRARQKEAASGDRFVATALPLYDPASPPLHSEAFTSREQRRHGYIEIFRLRFGRRSRD